MNPEIIYMKSDGIELTSHDDPNAIAYIRSDTVTSMNVTEKIDLFMDGGEYDPQCKSPCDICIENACDRDEYPCAACIHN